MSFDTFGDFVASGLRSASDAVKRGGEIVATAAAAPAKRVQDPVERLTGWTKQGTTYVMKGGSKVPTWAVGLAVAFGGLYVLRKLT